MMLFIQTVNLAVLFRHIRPHIKAAIAIKHLM